MSSSCCHRLKPLKEPVYSQQEAERAAGMGNYKLNPPEAISILQDVNMDEDQLPQVQGTHKISFYHIVCIRCSSYQDLLTTYTYTTTAT